MKKILTLLLSLLMILSLVGCKSKKEEVDTHIHQYEVDEDGMWICTEDSNILSNTDKPYVAVLENNEPKDIIPLDSITSNKTNLGNGVIYKEDNTIFYNGNNAQTIIIKTEKDNKNNEDKVVINAPNDTVYHYGSSSVISLDAVATNSFHEYGKVDLITLTVARIVLETLSNVKEIYLDINNPSYNYESAIIAVKEKVEIPNLSRDTVNLQEGEVKTLAVIQQLKDETNKDNTIETKTEEENFVKIENVGKSDKDLIIQAFLSPNADTKDKTKLETKQTSTVTLEEAKEGSNHPASKNVFVSKDEKVIEAVKPQETSKKDETKQETKQETKPVVAPSVTPKQEETKKDDPTPTPTPTVTNYTVSFDMQGHGTQVPSQTIANGSLVTKPDDQTFAKHTLEGWYKTKNADGTLSNKWDFNSPVTADMTLYAKWTRRIVDIIETVNFPMYTNDIPTNAWMDSSKPNNRIYGYNNWLFNILYVKANSQSDPLLQLSYGGMTSDNAEKNGNSYTFSNDYMKYTVTFNMTNEDKLESIEVKALEGADENVLNAVGTYIAPAPVSVMGVTLNKESIDLPVGETGTLTATVLPDNATDKSVTWSSNDENVATVDNEGNVHAVAAGNATITVTTVNGNRTATCPVTVTAATVSVTSVSLNINGLELTLGDEDVKLTATVLPDNATDKSVTWSSNDENVATVDNEGNVHAVAAGNATITVTTVNGNRTATCEVTVAAPAATYKVTFEPEKSGDVETGEVHNESGQKVTQITVASGTLYRVSDDTITIGENTFTAVPNGNYIFNSFNLNSGTITTDTTIIVRFTEPQP